MKSSKQLTYASDKPITFRMDDSTTHLSFPCTSKVPLLTELASTSDIRNGKNPLALLYEFQDGSAEERVNRDVETPVSYDPVSSRIRSEKRTGVNGPYCSAGAVPSRGVSLCLTMNIGTLVPSLLAYQTWVETKSSGGRPLTSVALNDLHFSSSFSRSSKRYW